MLIANRTLKLHSEDIEINIRIYVPIQKDQSWWCPYEIDWPHGTWKSAGAGVDSVQALLLTFEKIGTEIYTSEYHKSGKLAWDKTSNGYGFPVPKNIRDLLIGDDAKFF